MTDLDDLAKEVAHCRYFVLRHLQDGDATDDLLQNLFLALAHMPDPRNRRAYVKGAARILVCRWFRSRYYARLHVDSEIVWDTLRDDCRDPEYLMIRAERVKELNERLGRLKPKEREMITRVHLDGEKSRHVRASMGVSECEFRNRKSRGLDAMADPLLPTKKGSNSVPFSSE